MTNIEKAIELLGNALEVSWGIEAEDIEQALALLREKPEPTAFTRELRDAALWIYMCHLTHNAALMRQAADLLDQQAQEIECLTHLVADLKGEASKAQEAINAVSLPDPPTMDVNSPRGTKVVFAYPNAGYEAHRFHARRYLTIGCIYTIERTEMSQTSTRVYLKEVTDQSFNSALFAPAINEVKP